MGRGRESPKRGDFIGWADWIVNAVAHGGSAKELRSYLKSIARGTWQLVNWLTHATNGVRMDGQIAVDAIAHVLTSYGIAIVRNERGAPDRYPECSSYRITSLFEPESDRAHPYVTLSEACGRSDASALGE